MRQLWSFGASGASGLEAPQQLPSTDLCVRSLMGKGRNTNQIFFPFLAEAARSYTLPALLIYTLLHLTGLCKSQSVGFPQKFKRGAVAGLVGG